MHPIFYLNICLLFHKVKTVATLMTLTLFFLFSSPFNSWYNWCGVKSKVAKENWTSCSVKIEFNLTISLTHLPIRKLTSSILVSKHVLNSLQHCKIIIIAVTIAIVVIVVREAIHGTQARDERWVQKNANSSHTLIQN